jgi:long-subunit fatty acid transport protein
MNIKRMIMLSLSVPFSFGIAIAGSGQQLTSEALTTPTDLDRIVQSATDQLGNPGINHMDDVKKQSVSLGYELSKSKYTYSGQAYNVPNGKVSGKSSPDYANLNYAYRLNDKTVLGLSYSSPYLFDTKYSAADAESGFPGVEKFPTRRSIQIKDLSPAVSYRLNDKWVIGAALDFTDGELNLDNVYPATLGEVKVNMSAHGTGYHAGVKFTPLASTWFEASYYSKIKYDLKGDTSEGGNTTVGAKSTITQPYAVKLAYTQALSPKNLVAVMAGYTHWSSLPEILITGLPAKLGGQTKEELGYTNEWTYTAAYRHELLGGNLKHSKCSITGGVSYDTAPAEKSLKTATSLEPEHYWLGFVSASYAVATNWNVEGSFYHAFIKDEKVASASYNGNVAVDANGVGITVSHQFA